MPKLSENQLPAYRLHKATGKAVVTLDGRDIYLGDYATAASRAEYNRIIAEWIANGRRLPVEPNALTIAELVVAFRRHALTYYRDADGNLSRAVENIDEALKPVVKLYGRTPAAEFGPLKLKTVRDAMIAADRVRSNVNRHVVRIRSVFKWAAENELIPASVHHGLMALSGLRAGRCGARESQPVKPVSAAHVEAVLPHVSRHVAAMARLQMFTGMRPGEVVLMRGMDLDTTGKVWVYKPSKHKTQVHGKTREVYIGPKAQTVLAEFLRLNPAEYLFDPRDAERERREKLHASRKTPMNEGNKPGTNKRRKPKRTIGERYNVASYYNAIRRGCDKAFPAPEETKDVAAWRKAHRFHPHQIRHTRATEVRKGYGIEAAQAVLGHSQIRTTEIYAERLNEAAARVAAEVG